MASKTCNQSSSISAEFSGSGSSANLVVSGTGNANVTLKLGWRDNPDDYGDAIDTISLLGQTWNSPGEDGSVTKTLNNVGPGTYGLSFGGLLNDFKSVSNSKIQMLDNDGNDANAEFEITVVSNNSFSETVTASMSAPTEVIGTNCVSTNWSGSGPGGTTYSKTGPGTNSSASGGSATICGGNSNPCGGSGSPVSRTWTMTTTSPNGCTISETKSTNIYNDDKPTNSWTTSFINLEPSTLVTLNLGTMACIDAPSTVSAAGSGNFVGNGGSFSGTKSFNNGETLELRTTTLPFNLDTSGTSGATNSKTVTISFPNYDIIVTITTKAPIIEEIFDYPDNINKYPYEDIDLISNTPTENITTAQLEMNDIDIPVEFKASDGNTQININGTGWVDVRST
jgi:hypothetical protein